MSFLMHRVLQWSMACAWICHAAMLQAAEDGTEGPAYTVSGFGTVGAVYHREPGIRYRRDIAQGSGVADGKLSFKPDSMLGVQFDMRLLPNVIATAQAVSRLTAENNYEPEVTMAYLKLQPAEELTLRLGRMMLETYIQGDSAEIGYANLLIRQPIIYYPRGFDGVDVETAHPLGAGMLRLKGAAGWTHGKLLAGGDIYDTAGSRTVDGAVEYAWGGWTGRFYANHATLDDEQASLHAGAPLSAMLALMPNGAEIRDRLSMAGRVLTLRSLALAYDSGPLRSSVSYSEIASDRWPTRRIAYADLGYRFGKLTPYAAYAAQHSSRHIIPTGLAAGSGSDALIQASSVAQGAIMLNQSSLTFGARYDIDGSMALKLQADHIRYRDPESIIDAEAAAMTTEARGYRSFNLFSVALDFVF